MRPITNILVDINETASAQPALEAGVYLARRCGAQPSAVDAVSVSTHWPYGEAGGGEPVLHGEPLAPSIRAAQELAAGLARLRPAEVLAREVERFGHNLVIRSRARDLGARDGGVTLELLRRCPCAILAWKPVASSDRPLIVAAVNASSHEPLTKTLNRKVIETALFLAGLDGAELAILQAWNPPAEKKLSTRASAIEYEASILGTEAKAGEDLQRLVRAFGRRLGNTRLVLRRGDAAQAIAAYALAEGAGLVVGGTRGGSGLWHRLFGSTAERLLDTAPSSVLAVKPDGSSGPAEESAPHGQ